MKKKMLLSIVAVMVVSVLSSSALAGGFFGAPCAPLPQGDWSIDAGYWYEEVDLYGWGWGTSTYRSASEVNEAFIWGDWSEPYYERDSIDLLNFQSNTWLASFEYGVFPNWTWYVRAGMADGQADFRHVDWEYDSDDEAYGWDVYTHEVNFGYGFAWQIGTCFTIYQTGPWTLGGRMQFGAAYPDSDAWSVTELEDSDPNEYYVDQYSADVDSWQAVAMLGGCYQVNDALSLYGACGWQTMEAVCDFDATENYYDETVTDDQAIGQGRWSVDYRIRHESIIGLFGCTWQPRDNVRVCGEVLVGEAGKIGAGISGAFCVP